MVSMKLVDCEETTCALVMVTLFIPTVDTLMLRLSVISQKFNQIIVLLATSVRRHRRSHVKHVLSGSIFKRWQGPLEDILVDSDLSAIITGQTFPAAIQSEAPSGEPNNTTDQATNSTIEKKPCEHQPVTDNNLQEPLLLYDQIVAGEVRVAATVCSEHTFPAAIQSEAPSGEPNNTTDQATNSTSEKEPCEHQPVTDNDLQEPLLLYDQIVAGEVTVAATVCSEHTLPAAIQSEAPSGEPNNKTDQATKEYQ